MNSPAPLVNMVVNSGMKMAKKMPKLTSQTRRDHANPRDAAASNSKTTLPNVSITALMSLPASGMPLKALTTMFRNVEYVKSGRTN